MTLAADAMRYWHTLRHLRPIQFYGRLWFKLHRPRVDPETPPPALRVQAGTWCPPVPGKPTMLGPWHFRFLGLEHHLPTRNGWNDHAMEKLWLYNLHYFDDLTARDADHRAAWHQELLCRWIAENPVGAGNGWEPYPISLRIVNWAKWLVAGNPLPAGFAQSLATQARWLAGRLEWHLLGNHLFANAKAMVFAGMLFDGAEAKRWLDRGMRILEQQLREQVLPDGGHFERSTMYHALCLQDLLDLLNAAGAWPNTISDAVLHCWRTSACMMLQWLDGMTHPDGQIALFNDAAFSIAPEPRVLRAYAKALGLDINTGPPPGRLALRRWADSGYILLAAGETVAFLDVAPVGPDYLPGHAHADTLSFELSVFGQRTVVNGGTSRYGIGPERLAERQTAAHSTVEVARQSSSEVWGGFRVARRARPVDLTWQDGERQLYVACSHDGYTRLPGAPIHRREWTMDAAGLTVMDSVQGGDHTALARYILHPSVGVTSAKDGWRITLPYGGAVSVRVTCGKARLDPAIYAPEFGRVIPTQCLAVELADGRAGTHWTWH